MRVDMNSRCVTRPSTQVPRTFFAQLKGRSLVPMGLVNHYQRIRLPLTKPTCQVCTGAEVEMITDGGEVAFVSRMISESLSHPSACRCVALLVEFKLLADL